MTAKLAKNLDWTKIQWFEPREFDDPDQSGSWEYMSATTILLLDWLRKNTGWPIITHNRFGIHGCVCMSKDHHSLNSLHNYDCLNGCSAVDWHFRTEATSREQARIVLQSGFTGIGIYQDCWKWMDKKGKSYTLPMGFHCDLRKRFQVWKYVPGAKKKERYDYLLK